MPDHRYSNRQQLLAPTLALLIVGAFLPCEVKAEVDSEFLSVERCTGFGELQSFAFTDWETGLQGWTAGTYGVTVPNVFATPDWAAVGILPDGRSGSAAFVANLDIGDCLLDDQTGALHLDSPAIEVPVGADVPRISLDHWFDTEFEWDGGNLKISVNDGSFQLIPAAAIEKRPYTATLEPPIVEAVENNTNPLADQDAFTGNDGGPAGGRWSQTRVNLLGIAQAGDIIRLRLDFGVDCNGGEIGWYVDDLEMYYCEAELPPSNCGNGEKNGGEQCDDGNRFVGDGCSNTCDIEPGWTCTSPLPSADIKDPGFEIGTPNQHWDEFSTTPRGSPICSVAECGNNGGGTGPSEGEYWAWFGGTFVQSEKYVSQTVKIPATATRLTFDLEMPRCDSGSDYVEVRVDDIPLWSVNGADPRCGSVGYENQSVDISAFADGSNHVIEFYSETFAVNGLFSNLFVDDVRIPGEPSVCRRPGTNLNLVLEVINGDGGEAVPSDWTLLASGPSGFSGPGPVVYSPQGFLAGSYDLSVPGGVSGYDYSGWLCEGGNQSDGDTIVLAVDEVATCTMTANDRAPTLTLLKTILNDNNGPVSDPNDFDLRIDGQTALHGVVTPVDVGDHIVSETSLPGYTAGTWGGDCAPDGSITLGLAQNAVCSVVNDDNGPSLKVVKTVINDNGGTVADPDAFGLAVDGMPVSHDVAFLTTAGNHTVSEAGLPGYVPGTWGGDCNPDGTITLELEQVATCTITNDDSDQTSLTLVKQVVNDNGGSASASDWTLSASGPDPFSGSGPNVYSGQGLLPGTYTLSESGGPGGYTTGDWICNGGEQGASDSITVALGEVVTCTVTNDDVAPSLTLFKSITNDDGGTVSDPNAFGLKVDGMPVSHGVAKVLDAGMHTASESGLPGYLAGSWGGDCAPDGSITLAPGEVASCTIGNDDIAPTLMLVKTIVNDDEGTVTDENAFGLRLDGALVSHNVPNPVSAGVHVASEDGLAGYVPGTWGGDCNPDGSIELALAQVAECTITNDDIDAISLTLVKSVVNNDGGTALPSDWILEAAGPTGFSGAGPTVSSGPGIAAGTYTLSESGGVPGYSARPWECNGGNQTSNNSIELVPGDIATCTIVNDDLTPSLKILNTVINDDGGTVTNPNAFQLKVDGFNIFHNQLVALPVGDHQVTAEMLPGYEASTWGGDCNTDGTVTLSLDQDAVCTISHDDIAPTLTLIKQIVNDDGGAVNDPDAFGLRIDGSPVESGVVNVVLAGNHTVSEMGLPGYVPGPWSGNCNPDGTISLALAQDAVCTITNNDISSTSLTLLKQVINNNGGTLQGSAWTLEAVGPSGFSGQGPIVNASNITPGTYTLSETGPGNYSAGQWTCNGGVLVGNEVTISASESITCSVTNNDVAPQLTLNKVLVNDSGGQAAESDWTLTAAGPTPISGPGGAGSADVMSGPNFSAGIYLLSESGPGGYEQGEWVCEGGSQDGNQLTLVPGDVATCTVTNDDIQTSLTLNKVLVTDNGGQSSASDWTLSASGPTPISGPGGPGSADVQSGPTFEAGTYTLTESGPAGYSASDWVCEGGSQDGNLLTLAQGEAATCTIVNDDIPPSLSLNKVLVKDNGGTANESEWTLTASGPTPISGPGAGGAIDVLSGPSFAAGTYTLSESGPEGYQADGWSCAGGNQNGNQITLGPGEAAACMITNDDMPPSLTLDKQVVNDDGGTEPESAWTLSATGGSTPISGPGAPGNADVQSGPVFSIGTYTLSESGSDGYTASSWTCVGGVQSDDQVTVELGETVTCTITNDDNAASLALSIEIVNDNGGTSIPADWTLSADGPTGFNGPGPGVSSGADFEPGTYTLSLTGPDGYSESTWDCTGGVQNDDEIVLELGDFASCGIVVDDQASTITVQKTIVNDDGGAIDNPNAFGLKVDGNIVMDSAVNEFTPGDYLVSEDGLPGYQAGPWGGDCNPDGSIALALGQQAVCTVSNDDIAPTLKVVKTIVNDNGGNVTNPDAFMLRIDGNVVLHDAVVELQAGIHQVSEDGLPGYQAGDWGGDCNLNGTINLELGENAVCTVTNDDIAPTIRIVKTIINDNGGNITDPNAFGLKLDGVSVLNNIHSATTAGSHVVSESDHPGYVEGDWGGDCAADGSITLEPGQKATCTISNDDIAPTLKVVKTIINDGEGSITDPDAFGLRVDAEIVLHDTVYEYDAGAHVVSEDGLPGYTPGDWGGDCSPDGSITLSSGQEAICTITNDDGVSDPVIFSDGFEDP